MISAESEGEKKFENQSTFAKVMGNLVGGRFYETRCISLSQNVGTWLASCPGMENLGF